MSDFNTQEINRLIAERRSIFPKMYTGEKVSDEIIQQMLQNANWAPTHRFTEPWRFRVFTGKGLETFAAFQAGRYIEKNKGNIEERRLNKLRNSPLRASHIISIGMNRDDSVPEIEEIMAVACAVQNMALTATAYGIGSYWSTGGPTFDEEAKPFFGLGENDKLLGFLFVGVKSEVELNGLRKPIEDKVTWVTE